MPSGDVFPRRNLPGEAEDWGRKVEGRITDLETAVSGVGDTVGNQGRSNSGALALISDQIKQLAEVQAQQAETLATVQAVQADLAAQQAALSAAQASIIAQQEYLASLTISSARSTAGLTTVPANAWSSNSDHRVTLSNVRTSTGKLRLTVSGTVGNAAMLYSIDGQVSRDSLISGTGTLDSLNSSSNDSVLVGASKSYTITGLPVNTPLTCRTEVRGFDVVGIAGRVGIIAEVIA